MEEQRASACVLSGGEGIRMHTRLYLVSGFLQRLTSWIRTPFREGKRSVLILTTVEKLSEGKQWRF